MSYLKKYQWELVPKNLPIVKRNCPKCNQKTHYINTEKFRVNANKNSIDIWLIHQCKKCKSTWNMTIYERIKPDGINKDEYERFLSNDKELAREYGFNLNLYNKNKAEVIFEEVNYEIIQKQLEACNSDKNEIVVDIICKYPIDVRVDNLLSNKLGISRSKIKDMHNKGIINIHHKGLTNLQNNETVCICNKEIQSIQKEKNLLNKKVKDKMVLHLINVLDNAEIVEAIVQVI